MSGAVNSPTARQLAGRRANDRSLTTKKAEGLGREQLEQSDAQRAEADNAVVRHASKAGV